ncbi:MAG: cytochrome b/b6 domain-containing protein [Paracoccaceae bacterium]
MTLANTATRYGTISKSFHWLTALLILSLIPLGIIANDLPFETSEQLARKAFLFSLHKTLGVFVFFTALARIYAALRQTKPAPLHPDRKLEKFAADTVHWLLYGSLVLVPLSGWIHHAATTGFAPIWWPFGQNLPFVPKNENVASIFAGLHLVFERVLIASIFLHALGALKHHVLDKDVTLRRMWFGTAQSQPAPPHRSTALPIIAAIAAWVVALGIGSVIGVYDRHTTTKASITLGEVQTEWAVQDGTITFTITQFGSQVQGQFADWTAAIRFDEELLAQKAGDVDVQIAIPSMTVGSVTNQALGPDFFDVTIHPTAQFTADIVQIVDGYSANGTLTIRGATRPLEMPFSLSLDGDTANVAAKLTLDRRDFGIGDNMADEGSLGFSVNVEIKLTAQRNAE